VSGSIFLDTRVAGTAADPIFRGTATITGPVFGEFRAPLTRAAFNYRRKRLDSNLSFWRTGMSLMEVNAVLPLDLAWSRPTRGTRQMPGDLAIRIEADSMNLAVFEAFTRNIRQIRGPSSPTSRCRGPGMRRASAEPSKSRMGARCSPVSARATGLPMAR
jgi:hypothetical protein